jgi:hypothetical protein
MGKALENISTLKPENKMDVRKTSYEDGRWMEVAQNCV